MRRGRVPELGLFLLAYQLFHHIGISRLPPVTLAAIIIQVSIYLQFLVVPRICLSGEGVWQQGELLRLVVPTLRHTHDLHLYYNMVSLAWKGISLESRLGSPRFFLTLIILTLMSSAAYVGLALFGADLLEDFSIMRQCAIGFSGVLFAMKVLTCHYDYPNTATTSYFGWLVPMKYVVWIELLVIQIAVPNSSFLGHLAGILAGIVYIKGPVQTLLFLTPPPSPSTPARTSPPPPTGSRRRSLGTDITVGLLLCVVQICLHFSLLPNDLTSEPFIGCLPTRQQMMGSVARITLDKIMVMLRAPLHHLSVFHLALNLISFLVKSRRLEPQLGHFRYLFYVMLSVLGTSLTYIVLGRLWWEVSGSSDHIPHCVVGLSGALFALKVLTLADTQTLDLTLLFEMAELGILLERNNRLYHLAGLLTGVMILMLPRWSSRPGWGAGQRLGGGRTPGDTRGMAGYQELLQPQRTRSWGYFGPAREVGEPGTGNNAASRDEELEEALQRSRQTFHEEQSGNLQRLPPTAPPEEQQRLGPRVDPQVAPAPSYPPSNNAPPPPGPGFLLRDTLSRSLTQEEELRRRRLYRFS